MNLALYGGGIDNATNDSNKICSIIKQILKCSVIIGGELGEHVAGRPKLLKAIREG